MRKGHDFQMLPNFVCVKFESRKLATKQGRITFNRTEKTHSKHQQNSIQTRNKQKTKTSGNIEIDIDFPKN